MTDKASLEEKNDDFRRWPMFEPPLSAAVGRGSVRTGASRVFSAKTLAPSKSLLPGLAGYLELACSL
jgi:hypothetical protein